MVQFLKKMMQFIIIIFVKFLEPDQGFSLGLKLWIRMISFVGVIDIILVSILMKNYCSASRNLTERIKLHQFLKNRNQIKTKKN